MTTNLTIHKAMSSDRLWAICPECGEERLKEYFGAFHESGKKAIGPEICRGCLRRKQDAHDRYLNDLTEAWPGH